MTSTIEHAPVRNDIVAIAERASLYAILLSALGHQRRPQELPTRLYDDLNLPPSERPEFGPRMR